jgi:hypothetical protein
MEAINFKSSHSLRDRCASLLLWLGLGCLWLFWQCMSEFNKNRVVPGYFSLTLQVMKELGYVKIKQNLNDDDEMAEDQEVIH